LWGRGDLRTGDAARAIEEQVLEAPDARDLRAGLEAAGMEQERRSLRLRPAAMAWTRPCTGVLQLTFELPPGAYATTVLAELGDLGSTSAHRSS
jgi:tRNA pseudouridine13 synthase